MILLACRKTGVRVYEYTPLQVKQAVVGYGWAEKEAGHGYGQAHLRAPRAAETGRRCRRCRARNLPRQKRHIFTLQGRETNALPYRRNCRRLEPSLAVIDCGGIGFALNITANTAAALKPGARAKLFVAEAIGETNFDLYGFVDKSEKRCFVMLTSVSGIGAEGSAVHTVVQYAGGACACNNEQ